MLTKRYRQYVIWTSLAALTNACSDDSPTNEVPTHTYDAGNDGASDPTSDRPAATHGNNGDASVDSSNPHDTSDSPNTDVSDAGSTDSSTVDSHPTSSWVDAGSVSDVSAPSGTNTDSDSGVNSHSNDGTDSGTVDPDLARAFFWEAFTQERIDDGALAAERLERALATNPGDPELALLVAHSYLWQISEFSRATAPDPTQLPALAGAAEAAFGLAYVLAPEDDRILGWLGSVMIGNGHATGDATKVTTGHALIAQGVENYVEFNGFVQSLVNASSPLGTPEFDLAVEALWDNLDACAGFAVDRETPNVQEAIDVVFQGAAAAACANTLRAAHNFEGFFLYFGDVLLKAKQKTAAQAMYAATKASPTFDLWPYRATLLEREATLEARLAAYDNQDPSDDPLLIAQEPFNCSYCHAAAPAEPRP